MDILGGAGSTSRRDVYEKCASPAVMSNPLKTKAMERSLGNPLRVAAA